MRFSPERSHYPFVIRAVLLDIEGTLIDSLDLQVQAWQMAFARFGKEIAYAAMRAQLGGGASPLRKFLDDEERASFGQELEEYREACYRRDGLPLVKPFPQARELLLRLKQAKVLVGVVSTCKRIDLAHYLQLLDGASVVDAIASAEDLAGGEEVYRSCLRKLRVGSKRALAVGSTPCEVERARCAGLSMVGVLSGGFSECELRSAGCIAIFQGAAEIAAQLGCAPFSMPLPPGWPSHR